MSMGLGRAVNLVWEENTGDQTPRMEFPSPESSVGTKMNYLMGDTTSDLRNHPVLRDEPGSTPLGLLNQMKSKGGLLTVSCGAFMGLGLWVREGKVRR
jgi:hypothetical protein